MSERVISPRAYLIVFAALMVLLGATFLVDALQPGGWGFAVSIGIGAAKAVLIGVYFMHLRFSSALSRLVALGGLLWLAILLTFTLGDYAHRRDAGARVPDREHVGITAGTPHVRQSRGALGEQATRDRPIGDSPGRGP